MELAKFGGVGQMIVLKILRFYRRVKSSRGSYTSYFGDITGPLAVFCSASAAITEHRR